MMTVCHHSAGLSILGTDFSILTLMMDPYSIKPNAKRNKYLKVMFWKQIESLEPNLPKLNSPDVR